jgi:hypothetical protein
VSRRQRELKQDARSTRRDLGSRANGLRTDAKQAAERVLHLI